jgi:formylglycine-generating enzyme required for sulfatase activity
MVVLVVVVAVGSFAVANAEESKEAGGKTKSSPKERTFDLGKGIKLEMVLIKSGTFMMGSPDSDKDAEREEQPQHRVRITRPFYLGKYLVTQEQWEAMMGSNPSHFKGPKNPVEQVSWDDCQLYLEKLNAKIGTQSGKFGLPTAAQWEYACRAGSTTRYCFGDDESKFGEYAWYVENSGITTHPVGQKKPNAWGLYDMHGNVWEWCQDWNEDYKKSPVDDPSGPTEGSVRVFRGGSWYHVAKHCRSAIRLSHLPRYKYADLGFRVALIPADKVSAAAEPTPTTAPPKQITNSIGMKLTLVPSGEFMMGSKESAAAAVAFFKNNYNIELTTEQFENERPQHRVRISKPFYLGTYNVTRGQFRQFVKDSGYVTDAEPKGQLFPGAFGWSPDGKTFDRHDNYSWRSAGFKQTDEHPVVCVSWNDAVAFCKWLSKREGKTYRLPTEAEWEYACRAGTTTRYYSGDDPETLAKVGDVADATAKAKFPTWAWTIKASDGYVFTAPVGQFKPNAFGLYDMHGNAGQWCADRYGEKYYGKSPVEDPAGPADADIADNRVLRGSSWCNAPTVARSSNRADNLPDSQFNDVGFRVAMTQ